MRILLTEDDTHIGEALSKGLHHNGHTVEWVKRGEDSLQALETDEFDVVILDIGLQDISGLDVLRRIKSREKTAPVPVMILTANDDTKDKIAGLDAGADDYMTKPFDLQELLARIRTVTRRAAGRQSNTLFANGLELDLVGKTLKQDHDTLPLTASEFRILSLLMQRPGQIISKERITEELYGWDGGGDSNTVEVLIYNLRKRIGKHAILTMRGMGYTIPK